MKRPLTVEEKLDIQSRIEDVKARMVSLDKYITGLENSLSEGVWQYEPEAFNRMCQGVRDKMARWHKKEKVNAG